MKAKLSIACLGEKTLSVYLYGGADDFDYELLDHFDSPDWQRGVGMNYYDLVKKVGRTYCGLHSGILKVCRVICKNLRKANTEASRSDSCCSRLLCVLQEEMSVCAKMLLTYLVTGKNGDLTQPFCASHKSFTLTVNNALINRRPSSLFVCLFVCNVWVSSKDPYVSSFDTFNRDYIVSRCMSRILSASCPDRVVSKITLGRQL